MYVSRSKQNGIMELAAKCFSSCMISNNHCNQNHAATSSVSMIGCLAPRGIVSNQLKDCLAFQGILTLPPYTYTLSHPSHHQFGSGPPYPKYQGSNCAVLHLSATQKDKAMLDDACFHHAILRVPRVAAWLYRGSFRSFWVKRES